MTQPSTLQTHRILVLEDNADILRMIEALLQTDGYRVTTCARGAEAIIEILRSLETGDFFSVYLLDCALPLFDGFTVAKVARIAEGVRKDTRMRPRLAFFTGKYKTVEDGHLLDDIAHDAYLQKPVDLLHLRELIKSWTTPLGY